LERSGENDNDEINVQAADLHQQPEWPFCSPMAAADRVAAANAALGCSTRFESAIARTHLSGQHVERSRKILKTGRI